jgi:hypothetical protein
MVTGRFYRNDAQLLDKDVPHPYALLAHALLAPIAEWCPSVSSKRQALTRLTHGQHAKSMLRMNGGLSGGENRLH